MTTTQTPEAIARADRERVRDRRLTLLEWAIADELGEPEDGLAERLAADIFWSCRDHVLDTPELRQRVAATTVAVHYGRIEYLRQR